MFKNNFCYFSDSLYDVSKIINLKGNIFSNNFLEFKMNMFNHYF